jgi:hypothetical protein
VATPLPLPDDNRLTQLVLAWPLYRDNARQRYPRSRWLHDFEAVLREHYPQASSDRLTLTARNAAPFYLALPNVP